MKKNESGFTLFEMLIVIAIIAIMSAIVLPNFISWRNNSSLRGAAFNLKSDLELAKMRAIRGGGNVTVTFSGDGYTIKQGTGSDIIVSRQLTNVKIETTPDVVFDSRGLPVAAGSVTLKNKKSITIAINRIGLISM